LEIPNLPHESVPLGSSDKDNPEIRRWGTPPAFSFTPKDHVDLGTQLGLMDFAAAAKISGARLVVLYDQLANITTRFSANIMLDNTYPGTWL